MSPKSSDFLLDIRYPMYVQNRVEFHRLLPTTSSIVFDGFWWVEQFLQYQNSQYSTNEMRYTVITRKMFRSYLKIDWLESMSF